ncbi:MAG: HDOD domain-containing protein [Mariprofundus sp.]|nr:HDOD domain-containing protein [Mariprofundus sp.]
MKKSCQVDSLEQESMHQRVNAVVESMPPFPQSVMRLMEMTKDINCSPKDLVEVIEYDPVMTMKILKLVNSAFFALSRDIVSIQHALVYLGMNTVKNLAISIATIDALPQKSIPGLPMGSFLTHSLATAFVAQRLAKDCLHLKDVSDHFIAGLLHGFGKMVFIQLEPDRYAEVLEDVKAHGCSLAKAEAVHLGITYAEVGALLADSWQLPLSLVDCIRMHVACDADSSDMTITVAAANMVVTVMGLGANGDAEVEAFPTAIHQRLDVDMATVIDQMQALQSEVEQIQSMVGG